MDQLNIRSMEEGNKTGKPVIKNLEKYEDMANAIMKDPANTPIDFSNTEIAFANKTDKELKKAAWLFGLMNNHWLVGLGAKVGITAIKMRLPFVESVVKNTIFDQFCGGTTLLDCQKKIDRLFDHNALTILDYGVEAKETEEDFNHTMNENMRAIEFGAKHHAIPVVSTKITGLGRFGLLESIQRGDEFTPETRNEYKSILKRMDAICHLAEQRNISIFFDAEESWIQHTIDHLVGIMMKRYNRKKVVVYNTFQMYRTDRLQFLMDSFNKAKAEGYMLGAKLVRGAYMEKERERAEKMDYPSPIHPNKNATDDAYNTALRFCIDNYEEIASCNASHNAASNLLQAQIIAERDIPKNHEHLNFCQLYGMSDNLTFNLSEAGYNVAKYVPYGKVVEVVPYLIRRAQENASVTGDMSREYQLVLREMKRRGLS
ncbi:MAG: proline dehydrogenase [Saprospiraceae bacterium]|nr:MAG: proline dehydrogenase [Saprospiraceae bacterium]